MESSSMLLNKKSNWSIKSLDLVRSVKTFFLYCFIDKLIENVNKKLADSE